MGEGVSKEKNRLIERRTAQVSANQYQRYVRVRDAAGNTSLVREGDVGERNVPASNDADGYIPQPEYKIPTSEKQKKENKRGQKTGVESVQIDRRNFLKGLAAATGIAFVGETLLDSDEKVRIENRDDTDREVPFEPTVERANVTTPRTNDSIEVENIQFTPRDQLEKFGKIKDLEAGLRWYEREHTMHFLQTASGRLDIERAVRNLSSLEMDKFMEPFRDRQLPEDIAYLIALQETRGKIGVVSHAGARGIMGIMPKTLMLLGFKKKKVAELTKDPYLGSEVAAEHLEEDRKIFGNNITMLLHSYNGGANLFGFTKKFPKDQWTPEHFYTYMQERINTEYQDILKYGYQYTIKTGDTLNTIAQKYKISLKELMEVNRVHPKSKIYAGKKMRIPLRDTQTILDTVFAKEFELLHYVPEIRAKYTALKKMGYVQSLEEGVIKKRSAFG